MRLDEVKNNMPVEVKIYDGRGYVWIPAIVIDPIGTMVSVELPDGQVIVTSGGRLRPAKQKKAPQ
jgi:hypothetical protein